MASKSFNKTFFSLLLVSSFAVIQMAIAGDPYIISDFIVPANVTAIDANFFTFTGMRTLVRSGPPTNTTTFTAWKASMAEFPALNGQSVSYDVLYFPAGSINPPHTRVRATGLIFLLQGTLQVGLIDTTNKLYTQTLQAGDMFVFPKGLVHYQYNPDAQTPAIAIAAFGSSNPGSPKTLFNTNIDDIFLAKPFKRNVATILALKAGLTPKQ
ncbi:putative germin-like protein 9-2 [Quercus suber]|uniref:putative germin-like protein 9-2 n=1 Tax=Quercus suber TaxID=58331 RepID=UPI000CE16F44|nr:putative germin-like protein 9-2 [Quercus suber]POE97717.1 germin-like protein 9-3 [Quercus suber]